jgi:hypothetical protein
MSNYQCPNCKFYKIDSEQHESIIGEIPDPSSDFLEYAIHGITCALIGILVFAVGAVGGGILLAVMVPAMTPMVFTAVLCAWGTLVGCWCVYMAFEPARRTKTRRRLDYISYECRHCGYTWREDRNLEF